MRAAYLFLAALTLVASPAWAQCKLDKLGEMTVDVDHGAPAVAGTLNGMPARFQLELGGLSSLREKSAVAAGVSLDRRANNAVVASVRGARFDPLVGTVREITFGTFADRNVTFVVDPKELDDDESLKPNELHADGAIASDFLMTNDLEIDLAHGAVRMFRETGCQKTNLAYWAEQSASAELTNSFESAAPAPTFDVLVNGQKVIGALSLNTGYSIMDMRAASQGGLTPQSEGVSPIQMFDYGGLETGYVGNFTSVNVGGEIISNAKFAFADIHTWARLSRHNFSDRGPPVAVLGVDFIRAHRVFISRSQHMMYFTYNGGPIFRASTEAGASGQKAP